MDTVFTLATTTEDPTTEMTTELTTELTTDITTQETTTEQLTTEVATTEAETTTVEGTTTVQTTIGTLRIVPVDGTVLPSALRHNETVTDTRADVQLLKDGTGKASLGFNDNYGVVHTVASKRADAVENVDRGRWLQNLTKITAHTGFIA